MTSWHPITEADRTSDDPILLARFREGYDHPDYVVSAVYGTNMPGWTHLASYSGWFVDPVPLEDPMSFRGTRLCDGLVSRASDMAPTHWMPVPDAPK